MKLPVHLENANQWLLVGPMGPMIPEELSIHPILAIDGGINYCPRFDLWIGDGDSGMIPTPSAKTFIYPSDKDQSDLSLSLNLFGGKNELLLHFWGLLGGRRDHEWINIGETLSFLENSDNTKASFYNSKGNVELICLGRGNWNFNFKGIFSLMTPKVGQIKIAGNCKYQLAEWTHFTELSSQGLSNVSHGEFQISCGTPTVLFLNQEIS